MEKCPKCGKYLLERTGFEEKRCYKDGCTFRVYDDGSTSDLVMEFNTKTIKRVKTYPNGKQEIMNKHRCS